MEYNLDKKETERLLNYAKSQSWKSELKWIPPEEFLWKVPKIVFDKPSFEDVRKKLKEGKPLDPLFMDIKCGKIVNHEGRHRALASLCLDIKKVPVIINEKPCDLG
ncbi:MAG: hypothetical protein ACTSUF_03360 [Candidatus Heimdallarchaeaceae archaeon]